MLVRYIDWDGPLPLENEVDMTVIPECNFTLTEQHA